MKKILIATLICSLSLPVLATAGMLRRPALDNTNMSNVNGQGIQKPPLPLSENGENGGVRKKIRTPQSNQQLPLGNRSVNESVDGPRTGENVPVRPSPTLTGGLEGHITMLEKRLEEIDNSKIPEDKRDEVQADIEGELVWLRDMYERAEAATTEEERAALREETLAHITAVKTERQEKLSQVARLPQTSPFVKAAEIGDRFDAIVAHLLEKGVDTTELAAAIAEYDEEVAASEAVFASVSVEKSFENFTALRDQLNVVREKGQAVRNLLQSILGQKESI